MSGQFITKGSNQTRSGLHNQEEFEVDAKNFCF